MKPRHTFLPAILIVAAFASQAYCQPPDPSAPLWKDQSEYDIGHAALSESDPAKKLELLKKWEQQYPFSAYKTNRTFLTTQTLIAKKPDYVDPTAGPALGGGAEKLGRT